MITKAAQYGFLVNSNTVNKSGGILGKISGQYIHFLICSGGIVLLFQQVQIIHTTVYSNLIMKHIGYILQVTIINIFKPIVPV